MRYSFTQRQVELIKKAVREYESRLDQRTAYDDKEGELELAEWDDILKILEK